MAALRAYLKNGLLLSDPGDNMTQRITKTQLKEMIQETINEQLNRNQHSLDLEEQYLQRQKQLLQEIKSLTREFVKIQNMNFNKLHSSELNELAWEIEEVFKKELGKMFRDA